MEQGSGREPIPEGQIGIQELYQRCKCRNMSSQSKTFQVICEQSVQVVLSQEYSLCVRETGGFWSVNGLSCQF